jgi:hypothetical protein
MCGGDDDDDARGLFCIFRRHVVLEQDHSVRHLKDNGRVKIQGEKLQNEIDLFSLLHIPVNKPTPSYHS